MSDEDEDELKRDLSFRDVFFLSFGGMSPLLSLLTYGAVALTYGGLLSPVVMLLGTVLVLFNGLVVMQLSKKFRTSGGYYTYAFQILTERVGLSTGWMYLFYSMLFGLAYVIGAVFVVTAIFGFPYQLTLMAILVPSITFILIGIKPSAKYAIYSGIAEISIIIAIVSVSFVLTKGSLYIPNPAIYHISAGSLALGILFAMGIPTGYGAIAPISGEVKDPEKSVGRAVISVILVGGLLATLFLYGISNLLFQFGLSIPGGVSGLPVLSIVSHDFSSSGRYFVFALAIAAINDGILALLSFGMASSRTIFRMGLNRSFPYIFSRKYRDQPIIANIVVSCFIAIIPLIMTSFLPLETSFIILGTIASLAGLFIHITAGFSLLRVGIRKGKRLVLRGSKHFLNFVLDYDEAILAGFASVLTTIELIYSAFSTLLIYLVVFLVWIVFGYIIVDIKDVVSKTPYSTKTPHGESSLSLHFRDLTSLKIRSALPDVVISIDSTLREAMDKCLKMDSQGAIVSDRYEKPVGTFMIGDIFLLSEEDLERMHVRDIWIERIVTVNKNTGVSDIMKLFKETKIPILCIVEENGKIIGTVREREVLMALAGLTASHN